MEFNVKLNNLITNTNFLELAKLHNRPNLFDTIAASHIEMWHSAFIKWLIDPNSHLGLGDFPLKRFLFAIMEFGRIATDEHEKPKLTLGALENMKLDSVVFETEFTAPGLINTMGKKVRLDIIGSSDSLRLIIENKVKAKETNDQTLTYHDYAKRSSKNFQYDFLIFLTPDESQLSVSDEFIQITYQEICDFVIKPCLKHPELPNESTYLLEQYLLNLGKPIKGGQVMALPNKDICREIYDAHNEVLDEIFLAVKGEVPQSSTSRTKIRRSNSTLEQLIENNILDLSDNLIVNYKGEEYSSHLNAKKADSTITIIYNDTEYDSPSSAATAITSTNVNGWNFLRVKDNKGQDKGSLNELRGQLDKLLNNGDED